MALRPCLRCRRARRLSDGYCDECGGREGGEPWRMLYRTRSWMLAVEAAKNRAGHRCEETGCTESHRLTVHHTVKLRDLWRSKRSVQAFVRDACRLEWLVVLCPLHHARRERPS